MSDGEPNELSWAAYALDGRVNHEYWTVERFRSSFPPGSYLVDVGCGTGVLLERAMSQGSTGLGVEPYAELVELARARGCEAVVAPAERLPVESGRADGVIFAGVLPFTDEDRALAEIARVMRPGARMEAYYLGVGFAVRDLLLGAGVKKRYFGARALVNTVLTELFGVKLPGKYGDTVYVSHRRLAKLYARHGLVLRAHAPSRTFLGMPVFIYHSVDRAGAPSSDGAPGDGPGGPARPFPVRPPPA
jgi:SAM-dependent methyltransferase